ncbi:hypothetical protein K4G61_g3006 [Candida parapsilosis]|nr:hypothetical protein K4G61_g3006 [Candida parapsilosis]
MKFSIAVLTAIAAALVASAPVASKEAEVPALPVDNVLERVVEAFFNGPSIDAEIKDKTAADVKGVVGSQKREAEAKPHWTTYAEAKPHWTTYGYYEPQKRDANAEAEAKPHWTTYGYYEPQK